MLVVGVVLVVGFLGFGSGGSRDQGVDEEQAAIAGAVAMVVDQPVPASAIESMAEQQLQMFANQMGNVAASAEASSYAYSTEEQLRAASLLVYAKKLGVNLDDDSVIRTLAPELEQTFTTQRENFIKDKTITATATEAEFDAAYKKKFGMSVADAKNQQIAQVKTNLADPTMGRQMRLYAANNGVLKAISSGSPVSDEQLKKNYDDYHTRRIFLDPKKHQGKDLKEVADKIIAEVKGGLDFGEAMEKYSDEPASEGKMKSDNTFIVSGVTLQVDAEYAPVANMKVGDIQPVPMTGGVSIFKLENIVPQLPADFDQKKEEYRKQLGDQLAVRKMQDELTKIMEGSDIKWLSEGYHVLYDWSRLQTNKDLAADTMKRKAAVEAIKERAAAADDPIGGKMAILTRYLAFTSLWDDATPEDQKKMVNEKIEILSQVSDVSPHVQMLFELTDLLVSENRKDEAGSKVEQAVQLIQGDFSPSGQSNFGDIAAKVQKLKDEKVLSAETVAQIQSGLDQWRSERAEAEKAEAEAKKQEEEDRKQAEAEQKKEEAKNAKPADTKKATPEPAPSKP